MGRRRSDDWSGGGYVGEIHCGDDEFGVAESRKRTRILLSVLGEEAVER